MEIISQIAMLQYHQKVVKCPRWFCWWNLIDRNGQQLITDPASSSDKLMIMIEYTTIKKFLDGVTEHKLLGSK